MRVLTIINGRRTVTEVFEFEPIDDTSIQLNTPEHLLDIKITGIPITEADAIATKLLTTGYADLSNYHAEFDEEPEDDEPEYETECPDCGANVVFDKEVYERGGLICPQCGSDLEFDGVEAEENADRPTRLMRCVCGTETRFDEDVLRNGQAYCPNCFKNLDDEETKESSNVNAGTSEKHQKETSKASFKRLFLRTPKNSAPWEM